MGIWPILTFSLFCANLQALESPSGRLARFLDQSDFKAQMGVAANYVENRQTKARVFEWFTRFRLVPEFTSTLRGHLSAGFTLGTGSHSGRVLTEYAPDQEWDLQHAFLEWRPASWFAAKGGAIDQSDDFSPLLAGDSTFVALVQEIDLAPRAWGVWPFVKLQQAIPPGEYRLSPIGSSLEQDTPLFFSHTLGLAWRSQRFDGRFSAQIFRYQDLSREAAFRSQFMGNSLSTYTESTARFLYPFEGLNFSLQNDIELGPNWGLKTQGQYLYNRKAPHRRNTGYLFSLGLRLSDGDTDWVPFVSPFRNESDTSPAFYNSKYYGHNNQRGTLAGLTWRRAGISASATAGIHKVIFPNPYQSDGEFLILALKREL